MAVLLLLFMFIFIVKSDDDVLVGGEKTLLKSIATELDLTNEQIQIIPDNYAVLGELFGIYYKPSRNNRHVKELWLCGSNITSLPNEVKQMPMLEKLFIINTPMEYIDSSINNLKGLRILNLSYNRLRKISNLDNLSYLEELNLSHNNISKIEGLGNLSSLKKLNLEDNNIDKIENLELYINELGFCKKKLVIAQKKQFINRLEEVNLKNNPFPCTINNKAEIHKLESRNVEIVSDCN